MDWSTDTTCTTAKTDEISSAPPDSLDTNSTASSEDNKDKNSYSKRLLLLLEKLEAHIALKDLELVKKAYHFLEEHSITTSERENALCVAHILTDMKLDVASVVTGLLQTVVGSTHTILSEEERTNYHSSLLEDIQELFGTEIHALVQGVANIEATRRRYHNNHHRHQQQERETENYRKLILALAQDIRVVLVRLADQTQTMRMLDSSDNSNNEQYQQQLARETLGLYAPLAHRLGMYALKTELEDTSLRYGHPDAFAQLQTMVAAQQAQRQDYTDQVIDMLESLLSKEGISLSNPMTITGRPKSYFSIYQKMQSQQLAFGDIQDLMAFRILVRDVSQCYQALGMVHAQWEPVPGRFKDYIASPKPNGYQSLHTTVMGPRQRRIEVQIRTQEMHRVAEGGIAAHWMYKQGSSTRTNQKRKTTQEDAQRYKWLRQLVQWAQQQDAADGDSATSHQDDKQVVEHEVFVFSPNSQLFALAKGATVLDFAYLIHSELGNHCTGAKVNGKMVPLKYTMSNGDTVDILKSKNQTPKQEWLHIVQTSKAQSRIRSWLKKQRIGEESLALGREMLDKALRNYESRHPGVDSMHQYNTQLDRVLSTLKLNNEQQLLTGLAYGQIAMPSVMHEVLASTKDSQSRHSSKEDGEELVVRSTHNTGRAAKMDGVVVGGKRNMLISFCRNCNALYGEEVQGVVTQGRGVKIHRLDCRYLLDSDPARRVDAIWDDDAATAQKRALLVEVLFEDAPGMLAEMNKAISSANIHIGGVVLKTLSNGRGLARFVLMLSSIDDLCQVTLQLEQEPGVLHVKRG